MAFVRAAAAKRSVALGVLLFGVYAYFYQAGGWNQNSRFDLVRAVVERGSLQIDPYEGNTGDDSIRDGHYYCDKAPGASWLCIPTYAAVHRLAGAPDPVPPGLLAWSAWLAIVLAVGAPSAVAAAYVARVSERLGAGRGTATIVALGWGLGTMALPYATLLYGNQLAAVLTFVAFALLVEVRHGAAPTRARLVLVGALLGYSGATEYPSALIAVPVAAYALRVAGLRRAAWGLVGGAAPLAALLLYHAAAFGSPFAFPYDYSVWPTPRTGVFMGIDRLAGSSLRKILVGEYRGLLTTTPWLGLALPGAVLRARRNTAEVLVCCAAVVAFLWLNASIPPWHGGWAAGPRYLVPMLPFAAVLAGVVLSDVGAALSMPDRDVRRLGAGAAVVAGTLLLVSVANMFAATAVKPEIDTRWARPYGEFVWPNFRAGRLSVSTQSIDMLENPDGAPRQAWNLGMQAGLSGHASLVPLYVWGMACGVWLAFTVRRRSESDPVGSSD